MHEIELATRFLEFQRLRSLHVGALPHCNIYFLIVLLLKTYKTLIARGGERKHSALRKKVLKSIDDANSFELRIQILLHDHVHDKVVTKVYY